MQTRTFQSFLNSILLGMVILLLTSMPSAAQNLEEPPSTRKADIFMAQARLRIAEELTDKGFCLGQPVFLRIFKIPKELEVWVRKGSRFELFKTYPICSYSGYVGPKLQEGDWQSPEGFYTVSGEQMNPKSRFHLSFDIGYPNAFDTAKDRTGSAIMVHGDCISQGCFAMGDEQIEEIYLLAYQAFIQGQGHFSLHIFPFRMNLNNLKKYRSSPWFVFWKNLREGYNAFERNYQVPIITPVGGRYIVRSGQQNLAMLEEKR